jgi:small multidrug resistance pump
MGIQIYFVFYATHFVALTLNNKKIEVNVSYAVWSGVGTVLNALIDTLYFKKAATMLKVSSILLTIAGMAGLKFASSH